MKPIFVLLAVFALAACEPDNAGDQAAKADTAQAAEQHVAAAAPDAVIPLPAAMLFNGQPIDPMCFTARAEESEAKTAPMALQGCRSDDIIIPENASLVPDEDGLIGYEYGYRVENEENPIMGAFSKYRYLGEFNGHQAVLTIENGGGSGVFTVLSTYDRVGDALVRVRDYAGGDRCNNGVTAARIADGVLHYDVNMTPPDILAAGGVNDAVAPYDDLEASAVSCFATASFENGRFTSLAFVPEILEDRAGWTENATYQPCFNQLARQYVTQGQVRLDAAGTARFARDFQTTCLKN